MKTLTRIVISTALLALPLSVMADDDDDDRHRPHHHYKHHHKHHKHHYHGHKHHGYTKTYWDGNCKVKVRHFKHGGYHEKRHCMPQHQVTQRPVYGPVHTPAPVVIQPGIGFPGIFPFPY